MNNYFLLSGLLIFSLSSLEAKSIQSFKMNETLPSTGPVGNGITDIVPGNNILWFGTGEGLTRYFPSGGSFESYQKTDGLAKGSISAIWAHGDSIWIAAASDSFVKSTNETLPFGTGFSFSENRGETWEHFKQPGPTPIQNLCYDITVVNGVVWGASFGGGLLKSKDWGQSWEQTSPDTLVFDPNSYLNHRAFSVLNADGMLWVGTAGGVNKSEDNGITWINYNATNQQNPISGDFVVALWYQKTEDRKIIWAATWKAEGQNERYGVSKTENMGLTWDVVLEEEKAQNICSDDAIVYVATHNGLYKSPDYGETWFRFPPAKDNRDGEKIYTTEYYSVFAEFGTVWVGTADGLAKTANNGFSWNIYRAFQQTGQNGHPRTYAYPNPFSPNRHNELEGDGHVRLQYNVKKNSQVTVRIYDFAMDLVTTVCENKFRPGPGDFNEVWNGKNDYDDEVANGVYFYSVTIENDGTYWGKIMIVN